VDSLLAQLEVALPWAVRKPLCGKMYDEFERLHAHMRLMLAQALVFPVLPEPLTESQQDALVLDIIDSSLGELNLYSHECSTLALMAEALAQGKLPFSEVVSAEAATKPGQSRETLRTFCSGLQWEVEQHERRLRELRPQIEALNAKLEELDA